MYVCMSDCLFVCLSICLSSSLNSISFGVHAQVSCVFSFSEMELNSFESKHTVLNRYQGILNRSSVISNDVYTFQVLWAHGPVIWPGTIWPMWPGPNVGPGLGRSSAARDVCISIMFRVILFTWQ